MAAKLFFAPIYHGEGRSIVNVYSVGEDCVGSVMRIGEGQWITNTALTEWIGADAPLRADNILDIESEVKEIISFFWS